MSLPILRRVLAAAAVLTMLLLGLHWRPSRQVRLHQEHLFAAVGDRSWKEVGKFLAPDYRDQWDQTRQVVLDRLPQVFGNFLACAVLGEERGLEWRRGDCLASARIRIAGSGGPLAQYVIEASERFDKPFVLTWRRQSWKPWDWALVRVDQPQLVIPADFDESLLP